MKERFWNFWTAPTLVFAVGIAVGNWNIWWLTVPIAYVVSRWVAKRKFEIQSFARCQAECLLAGNITAMLIHPWWLSMLICLPLIGIAVERHMRRTKRDCELLEFNDVGEDLDGKGPGFRLIKATVFHKHGPKQFITNHVTALPHDQVEKVTVRINDGDEDGPPVIIT